MALYCKNCNAKVDRPSMAIIHLNRCPRLGDSGPGCAADVRTSPKTLFDYFWTEHTKPVDRNARQKDVIYDAIFSDEVRPSVQTALSSILNNEERLRDFDYKEFKGRIAISGIVNNKNVYYRKMSTGEFDAISESDDPFGAVFDYFDTNLYRYWISSSLAKVREFGNENSSDAGGRIVKFTFSMPPWDKFTIRAHQETGVQRNKEVVAVHREGFAEIGPVSSQEHVDEIAGPPLLDHNLGFTSSQHGALKRILTSFEELV